MKKRAGIIVLTVLLAAAFAGCGKSPAASSQAQTQTQTEAVTETGAGIQDESETGTVFAPLADGLYTASFQTDGSMFHVNEACQGLGLLTVQDGKMTIHVSLTSKNIRNLYPGSAQEAQEEGALLLEPVTDTVTYSDGTSEEVNGFDIPVPVLGEEFDLALIGTKGKWYDHKVIVSDPVPGAAVPGYGDAE